MNKNLKPALLVGTSLAIAISAVLGAMSTGPTQNAQQEAAPPTLASQAPPAASAPVAILEPAPVSAPASAAPLKEPVVAEAPASAPEQTVEKVEAKAEAPAPEKRPPSPPAKSRPAIAPAAPRPPQESRREHTNPEPLDRKEVELAKATNPIYTTSITDAKRTLNFVRASTDSVTVAVNGKPREYKVGQSMSNGEKVLDVHHDVAGGIIITTSRQTLVLNPNP